ncbi:MAG: VTT domain-containing protein [Bacteroidales bacterium]|nr:VTT domain-containing protein [Bacteroidales bacterium]
MNKIIKQPNNSKKRSTKEKFQIYHKVNKRSGIYLFLGNNFLKLVLILAGIVLAIFLLDWIFDLKQQQERIQHFVDSLQPVYVFLFFYATESLMGLIPPDIFIVWSKARYHEHPYLVVTFLATISYFGGITAYYLGKLIRKSPRVNNYIKRKYEKNFNLIEKWGGLIIIMAALFPLPFAMMSTIAGMVKYPLKPYLLYGLTRYIRFYLYALVLFGALKNFF